MTDERKGLVILGYGPTPVELFAKASKVAGKDAVFDTDVARMAGANFAAGSREALDELRARLEVGALHGVKAENPGLSPEAAAWLAHGERGVSSNTIFERLTGIHATGDWGCDIPHDPDDLRRCRLLLERVPDLVLLFPRMAEVSTAWAAMVAAWGDLCATMDAECPDWRSVSRGKAPKTYELMRLIRREAGDA